MLKILITNKSNGLFLKQLTDLKKHIACWATCLFSLIEIFSHNMQQSHKALKTPSSREKKRFNDGK